MTSLDTTPVRSSRPRRTRRLLGAAAGAAIALSTLATAAPPASATDTFNWSIDANTLRSIVQQETNITRGDEVYVASIAFRSTPGVPGSTSAWFTGGLSDVTNVHQGETHTIPDSMGRITFPNVTRRSAADIVGGQSPEIIGTLTVAFESDLTSNSKINSMMVDIADVVETEVGDLLEPITPGSVSAEEFTALLGDAAADIQDQVEPSTRQKIGLFLGSFGDPDDLVAFKLNVFVAVDESLTAFVDDLIGDAIPATDGVGGALANRTYTQRFTGAGASYDVGFRVGT